MIWNAVYVKSRAEKKVANSLHIRGIECYLPLVKTMRQWSDRKKLVEMPLLGGYVFVKADRSKELNVLQTPGVLNFVKYLNQTAQIKETEINSLKQLVSLGYQIEVEAINREYKEGEKVKITSGLLKDLEGYVTDDKGGAALEVVLDNIGQVIRVRLPKEIITAI